MSDPIPERPSLLRRRLLIPMANVLKDGASADWLAWSISAGLALAIFPIFGTPWMLCLAVGPLLKISQPLLQGIAFLLWPIQLMLIMPFIHFGERIYGVPLMPYSLPELVARFFREPLPFFREFRWTYLHCTTAWLLVAPVVAGAGFVVLRPLIRRAAERLQAT
jgi:hypothetical protein